MDRIADEFFTLGDLARWVTNGDLRAMARLLNEVGASPRLNETDPAPSTTVPRGALVRLYAQRGSDSIGRVVGDLLRDTMGR